jgi:hypothetical protein
MARVIFVLIASRVQGIQNDHISGSGARGGKEVIQPMSTAQQVPGGTGVDAEIIVGSRAEELAHQPKPGGKLFRGEFELADQDPARGGNAKAGSRGSGRQSEGEIGDQQGLADFGLATAKQDSLLREQTRLNQAGGWFGIQPQQVAE